MFNKKTNLHQCITFNPNLPIGLKPSLGPVGPRSLSFCNPVKVLPSPAMADCSYPASPQSLMQDSISSLKQKERLSSETWSTVSGLPLLEQQRKEPWVFPVMRWVFILLALALLGFVLLVFGHLAHDYMVNTRNKESAV